MAKKKKKKKRVIFKIKNILICLLILALLSLGTFFALKMPIKNIYISGNNILSDEIILNTSKLSNYPSFLLTTTSEIKTNLKKNKFIDKLKIKKKIR